MSQSVHFEVIPDLKANPEQARELARFYLTETGDETDPDTINDQLDQMQEADELVIVAMDGETIIAMAGIRMLFDKKEAILVDVATSSAHQRKGWGTKVVKELEDAAYMDGVQRFHVFPGPGSGEFYHKLGFRYVPGSSFNPSWATKDVGMVVQNREDEVLGETSTGERYISEVKPGIYDVPEDGKIVLLSDSRLPFSETRLGDARRLIKERVDATARTCLMSEACGVGHTEETQFPRGLADKEKRRDTLEVVCDGECPLDIQIYEVPDGKV